MDRMFGNVWCYDTMIRCLYEICQKEGKTVEEYMLWIHGAMAVIHQAYPDRIADQGKNLTRDRFYNGLLPSLWDALSFAMADLPEGEQVNTSFDMLYTQAKKLEARQSSHSYKAGSGPTNTYRDWYQRYPTLVGRVATLEDEELFPPDPEIQGVEAPDAELPEFDQIEGLNMRITQAMNHYQQEEQRCFMWHY